MSAPAREYPYTNTYGESAIYDKEYYQELEMKVGDLLKRLTQMYKCRRALVEQKSAYLIIFYKEKNSGPMPERAQDILNSLQQQCSRYAEEMHVIHGMIAGYRAKLSEMHISRV